MSKGKDEAFEKAYASAVENGWTNVKHMARQVWDMACTTPPAAQVQGEQPEVVGQLALDEPFNGTEGLELGEWEFVPERAVVESMLAESTGEMVPLMTVAQYERTVAALEGERAEQWQLRRDFEARCDTQAAEIAELRAALSAPPAAGVPEGWKLVPMEPTAEMQAAGATAIRFDTTTINKLFTGNAVYRAAISAAPTPPASEPWRCQHCNSKTAQACYDMGCFGADAEPASEQQQAVVLPERKAYPDAEEAKIRTPLWFSRKVSEADAHNACLDELLRLNPHLAGVNQGVTTEAGNGGDA